MFAAASSAITRMLRERTVSCPPTATLQLSRFQERPGQLLTASTTRAKSWVLTVRTKLSGRHGFLRSGGRFSSIDFPGSGDTAARGINNRGQIVGDYLAPNGSRRGFLLSSGNYQSLVLNAGAVGEANGVNDAGQIVGVLGSGPAANGIMIDPGSFAAVEFPNTNYTEIQGVNDLGDIVGKIGSPKAPYRGFSRTSGAFNLIDLAPIRHRGRARHQ